MTYRERIAIEHPEEINPYCEGGVRGCPGMVYPGAPSSESCPCPYHEITNAGCTACWDRQAPPRKVKVRKKK